MMFLYILAAIYITVLLQLFRQYVLERTQFKNK